MEPRKVVSLDAHRATGGGGGGNSDAADWRSGLMRNKQGQCVCCHNNLLLIFQHDEALQDLFAMDEFANRIMFTRKPPWTKVGREWEETDVGELGAWLGELRMYGMSCKSTLVAEMVAVVATRNGYHPVRKYLRGLKWDGTPRVSAVLSTYFGVPANDYTQRVGEIFMISAAARILRPGCKVDTMMVLEGGQGIGKTRAVQALFGGDKWYMDAQRSVKDKDFFQELVGKWGVEIGEMTSFTKAEHNAVKQTMSATADTYRPSYGRYARTFPRQCVFVGTTNEDQYLRDPTGARRYLPVRVSVVSVDKLKADRDQLWAEAVSRFLAGEEWWELPRQAADEQEQRYMEDSWTSPIAKWLQGGDRDRYPEGIECEEALDNPVDVGLVMACTTHEVLGWPLAIDTGRHTRADQMRVAAIMRNWGWSNKRVLRNGAQVHLWTRPESPP